MKLDASISGAPNQTNQEKAQLGQVLARGNFAKVALKTES